MSERPLFDALGVYGNDYMGLKSAERLRHCGTFC